MSDFVLDVTRADDLLKLRLEFTNLALDPDETRVPRRLVRKSRGEDAFMTVFFPPQHISEFSFTEKPDGTLDRLPHPGHRVRVFSAGESRLGFRLRSDLDSIALTLDELLDWTRFEPVLAVTDASSGNQDQPPREVSEPLPLTAREREIVRLLGSGLTTREVADRLCVSARTVEGHIYRAMNKTGSTTREELIRLLSPPHTA